MNIAGIIDWWPDFNTLEGWRWVGRCQGPADWTNQPAGCLSSRYRTFTARPGLVRYFINCKCFVRYYSLSDLFVIVDESVVGEGCVGKGSWWGGG
jgi:hypothetical protein